MIVGNGLLANSLLQLDSEGLVLVAAGVSDSKCTDASEFAREKRMVTELVRAHKDKILVYFSSYSINDPVMQDSLYVKSKLALEQYIAENCSRFLIIRISNLVGEGGNPKNVFNFFFNQIVEDKRFSLWVNSRRNLIRVDDFARILQYILENELEEKMNTTFNVINKTSFSVHEIVKAIERHTGIDAKYDTVEIESLPPASDEYSERLFDLLNIDTKNYLSGILNRYFVRYKEIY